MHILIRCKGKLNNFLEKEVTHWCVNIQAFKLGKNDHIDFMHFGKAKEKYGLLVNALFVLEGALCLLTES